MSLYIIIPAYNEEDSIEQCVNDWYPIVEQLGENNRLVIINDGSKDKTYEKLQELVKTRPLLSLLSKSNGGHGSTVLYGYRYAMEKGVEWIFQTDSDGQTNPAEFAPFWEKRAEYDAIIGNRVARGDGAGRAFVGRTVCLLIRLIFGVKVEDANTPFRLMKTKTVAKYIDKLPPDFNIPNIMLTTYFVYFKEKVLFLPITFKSRTKGTNSINLGRIIKIGWKAVWDFKQLRKDIDRHEGTR